MWPHVAAVRWGVWKMKATCGLGALGARWEKGEDAAAARQRRGRALRGEDRENISAEGSVRAALGAELHATHRRSRKNVCLLAFLACRQGKDGQCLVSAAPSRGTRR